MALTFKLLGLWLSYTPEVLPEGAPAGAMFFQRESDGVDWYDFIRSPEPWAKNSLIALCENRVARGIFRAGDTLPMLDGWTVVEITGVDPEDPAPWKLFEGRILDLEAQEAQEVPPAPIVAVAAVAAKIQLSRTPTADGSDLLTKTEALVKGSGDRELALWFNGALTWRVDNPNTRKMGAALGLKAAEVQGLFDTASTIQE